MATHSSILTWRILWTEEPGGLQSMGHKESDTTKATLHAHVQNRILRSSERNLNIHRHRPCLDGSYKGIFNCPNSLK